MHHAYLWCITHFVDVWPRSLGASMHQLMLMHSSKPSFTLSLPRWSFPHPLQPVPFSPYRQHLLHSWICSVADGSDITRCSNHHPAPHMSALPSPPPPSAFAPPFINLHEIAVEGELATVKIAAWHPPLCHRHCIPQSHRRRSPPWLDPSWTPSLLSAGGKLQKILPIPIRRSVRSTDEGGQMVEEH